MNKKPIIAIFLLLAGFAVMLLSGMKLIEATQTHAESTAAYNGISTRVKTAIDAEFLPHIGDDPLSVSFLFSDKEDEPAYVHVPRFDIDFGLLREINNDAVAWLYSPGTIIDYPVMKSDNYSYYLNHLPDGTVNANGSLFIDYNNAWDFSDGLTVIYGHHMRTGSMFGNLKGYKEQWYYDENPYVYIYTEHKDYRVDILFGSVIGAGQWRENAFMFEENLENFLAFASENTTFESTSTYREGDKIVALSTCSYEFDNARYVVLGILRQGYPKL